MVIAVDGHAGSGKTTISKSVAKKLNILHVNTGAMYRAVTLHCLQNNITTYSFNAANSINISMDIKGKIFLNSIDVTEKINSDEITKNVSFFSAIPEIRKTMVDLQRSVVIGKDAIVEGRDIGSKVFPDAELKFFFTAEIISRAYRRQQDYLDIGEKVSINKLIKDLNERDSKDSTRKHSPLKHTKDAILIDTTNITIQDQVNEIVKTIINKRNSLYG